MEEDLLKPGHLSALLEEQLAQEVGSLCLEEVSSGLQALLERLRTHRDSCPPQQLQVGTPARDDVQRPYRGVRWVWQGMATAMPLPGKGKKEKCLKSKFVNVFMTIFVDYSVIKLL